MSDEASLHPPPAAIDWLLGATVVAIAMCALHAAGSCWELGLLGKDLRGP